MRIHKFALFGFFFVTCSNSLWAVNSLGRSYGFEFLQGNLVRNWSFESLGDNWIEDAGVTTRFLAKDVNIGSVSGRFVGKYSGTSGTVGQKFVSERFRIKPSQAYVLGLYFKTVSNTTGIRPILRYYREPNGVIVSQTNLGMYAINTNWSLRAETFTSPVEVNWADIVLMDITTTTAGGTFYFDDIVLEEGTTATPRDKIQENVSFVDEMGRVLQNHSKIAGGGSDINSRKYIVSGASNQDDYRRFTQNYMGYLRSGHPDFDWSYTANSMTYNNGSNGLGASGGYPYSELYFTDNQIGHRLVDTRPPGSNYLNKKSATGYGYVNSTALMGASIENPTYVGEGSIIYRWERDESYNYTLSWTDLEGKVLQTAVNENNLGGSPSNWTWSYSQYEYYSTGQLKKIKTPLDIANSGDGFREVKTFDINGRLIDTYSKDKGVTRYYYNQAGQLRFSRNQFDPGHLYDYSEYDNLGRSYSLGTQELPYFSTSDANTRFLSGTKTETKGNIYDELSSFTLRTGLSLSVIMPGITLGANGDGRVVCAYNRNAESKHPEMSAAQKLVADFYNYDSAGRVRQIYKYIGPIKSASQRIQKIGYGYDKNFNLISDSLFEGSGTLLLARFFSYDALGRLSQIVDQGGKLIVKYSYYDWGGIWKITLGAGPNNMGGTELEYRYHLHGMVRSISSTQLSTGIVTFSQQIGYDEKAHPSLGVSPNFKYDGSISQQLVKFTGELNNLGSVRATNYDYDAVGRVKTVDARKSTGNPLDALQSINFSALNLVNSPEMSSSFAYDQNGRITSQKSFGVTVPAIYDYLPNSYKLNKITNAIKPDGNRNMSSDGNFVYDGKGRMISDKSKNLSMVYGSDDMPLEITISNPTTNVRTTEFCFYDANGWMVSQVGMEYNAPPSWTYNLSIIGTNDGTEPTNLYRFEDMEAAWYATSRAISGLPPEDAPSRVDWYVVFWPNQPQYNAFTELGRLSNNGVNIPFYIHGIRKYSQEYNDLVRNVSTGKWLWSKHNVNLTGEGDRLLEEAYDAVGNVVASSGEVGVFGKSGKIGRIVNGSKDFFIKNHQGSVMRSVGDDGSYAGTVNDYSAYGDKSILKSVSNNTKESYTGKQFDGLASLYYFGARFYDPELGLWLTPDAMREFHNPYGRSGDPVNFVDPDGNCEIICMIVVGAAIGAAIGGAGSTAVQAYQRGDDWYKFNRTDWGDVGNAAVIGGIAGAAGGAAAFAAGGLAASATGYVGLATNSGLAASITGGAVTGAAAGASAGFAGYTAGVWAGNEYGSLRGWNAGDALKATLIGGGTGVLMGGAFSGLNYGLSDAAKWRTHETVLEYGYSKGRTLDMARYVSKTEGINFTNTRIIEGGTHVSLRGDKSTLNLSRQTGMVDGNFSASRFYSSVVHEGGHVSDRVLLSGHYSPLNALEDPVRQTRMNLFSEFSATRYEMHHRFFNYWDTDTQMWIGNRAAQYYIETLMYGL